MRSLQTRLHAAAARGPCEPHGDAVDGSEQSSKLVQKLALINVVGMFIGVLSLHDIAYIIAGYMG